MECVRRGTHHGAPRPAGFRGREAPRVERRDVDDRRAAESEVAEHLADGRPQSEAVPGEADGLAGRDLDALPTVALLGTGTMGSGMARRVAVAGLPLGRVLWVGPALREAFRRAEAEGRGDLDIAATHLTLRGS
jgi:hypothetical protein